MKHYVRKLIIVNINDQIEALVFDLDGTLFDTLPSLAAAANEVLRQAGLDEIAEQMLRTPLSQGLDFMFSHALALQPREPAPGTQQVLAEQFSTLYAHQFLRQARLYDGVTELIRRLHASGIPLAVCTNRDRASAQALLAGSSIDGYFAAVVGRGDAPQPKPAPDLLLRTLDMLALPAPQVLFVGDSLMDARCAEQSQVRFAAHLGGYAAQHEDLQPCVLQFAHHAQLSDWVLGRVRTATPTSQERQHA